MCFWDSHCDSNCVLLEYCECVDVCAARILCMLLGYCDCDRVTVSASRRVIMTVTISAPRTVIVTMTVSAAGTVVVTVHSRSTVMIALQYVHS